jgi:hypothetical protein
MSILQLPRPDFLRFRKLSIAAILATDMVWHLTFLVHFVRLGCLHTNVRCPRSSLQFPQTHHGEHTEAVRRLTPDTAADMPATRFAECLIHAADLSNPVLPSFPVVYKWAAMVCEEFSHQVELERAGGYPFAAHMAGLDSPQAVAKLQLGFVDYVVSPLWTALAAALPELADASTHLARNRATWKAIADGAMQPPMSVPAE